MKHLPKKLDQGEFDFGGKAGEEGVLEAMLGSTDCEICGVAEARDIWRNGEWFGRLCSKCERDGRRGVAKSRPRGWNLRRD